MATSFLSEVKRQPESRTVKLVWSDGFAGECAYDFLRGYCPCAGCQGHYAQEIQYRAPEAPVEPLRIEPVGNYAISIHWSDGHATGIYRYDFLRDLCTRQEDVS